LGALAALAMSTNLLIGLARQPNEWPWSYVMMVGYSLIFLSTHPGRVLGLDGRLSDYFSGSTIANRPWASVLRFMM
jgi:hypothetical protein